MEVKSVLPKLSLDPRCSHRMQSGVLKPAWKSIGVTGKHRLNTGTYTHGSTHVPSGC